MRRVLLTIAFPMLLVIGVSAAPRHASAALPTILPACDQTRYIVTDWKNSAAQCNSTTRVGCMNLSPAEYNAYFPKDMQLKYPPYITIDKKCGLNDFIQLFINLSSWGLAILAMLGVLIAVWGGFTMLISLGDAEKIKEGKATVWGAVLGTAIVLSSWLIINFYISALTGTGPYLFYGTPYERKFSGSSACEKKYSPCPKNDLGFRCRDDVSNGNAVQKAQQLLSQIGCYSNIADGCFGQITEQAVKNFQQLNGGCTITDGFGTTYSLVSPLTQEPDGKIDDAVWAFLYAAADGTPLMSCPQYITPLKVKTCTL